MAKLQATAWLSRALCASGQNTAKRGRKCTRQSHFCCTIAKYSPILIFFTHALSNRPFLIWLLTIPPHLKYAATLPCNLSLMAHFADINISQGSVATYAKCSGIFNMHLTADLPRNLPVKKFSKSVKISQNYGHESVAQFFASTLYIYTRSCTLRLCMTKHRPSHRHIHVQTFPNIVCLLFNSGAAASVKKNWLPLS